MRPKKENHRYLKCGSGCWMVGSRIYSNAGLVHVLREHRKDIGVSARGPLSKRDQQKIVDNYCPQR